MSDFEPDSGKRQIDSWFAHPGPETDVVLSTRVRLARNLASFPFPGRFKSDDGERIQSIVFDSFVHASNPENYLFMPINHLDDLRERIFVERGVIEPLRDGNSTSGFVIRSDGRVSCTINGIDHVRLASFVPGLDGESAFRLCHDLDEELQNSMQFAASYDAGFLTSQIKDCGSGMKISCRVHLPALSFSGKLSGFSSYFDSNHVVIKDCFGAGNIPSSSLGFFYQISSAVSGNGNEIDQLASLVSVVKHISENERRENETILESHQTEIRDRLFRTYAKIKFASLIELREAVEIISDIKWGKNLGFFSNVSDEELCALLYRIQDASIQYVMESKKFNFPSDIAENEKLKVEHLRTLMLQEAFEDLKGELL